MNARLAFQLGFAVSLTQSAWLVWALLLVRKGKIRPSARPFRRRRQSLAILALAVLMFAILLLQEGESAAASWALACFFSLAVAVGLAHGMVQIAKGME